jgi:uncharacterized protein YxeA
MCRIIYFILLLALIIILAFYAYYLQKKNNYTQMLLSQSLKKEVSKIPVEWNTRTKSFDSENAMPRSFKYMAEPDKCFDCTNQVAASLGTEYAIYEQPSKLFSMGSL